MLSGQAVTPCRGGPPSCPFRCIESASALRPRQIRTYCCTLLADSRSAAVEAARCHGDNLRLIEQRFSGWSAKVRVHSWSLDTKVLSCCLTTSACLERGRVPSSEGPRPRPTKWPVSGRTRCVTSDHAAHSVPRATTGLSSGTYESHV